MSMKCKAHCFKFIVVAIAGVVAAGFLTMYLWNWLTPDLFGWKSIGFAQAIGLLVLCRMLLGSWRGHCHGRGFWRQRMAERWERMSPEEREKFQAGMSRWCRHLPDKAAQFDERPQA